MDQNNANHLETIFFAALDIHDLEARARYLTKNCGQDAELRQRVDQMLAIQSKVGSFMENPPVFFDGTIDLDKKILDAGLTAGLREDQAVVIGSANHSVLKSLSRTLNEMPRVMLRDPKEAGIDPIVRPRSNEIPADHADSRYRLDGEIARGGMGAIIKGRDVDLGRDLAIKVLLDSHKDKPEVIQRFIEEAQIGGQLQHPGIVPVYELGQFGDQRPFFSMKLVKGQTLAQVLSVRKHPSEDRAKYLGIFEQICQTMAYAHSRGVIHRDLKPANIMIGAFGEVQVMDWGLAKVLSVGGIADEKRSLEKQTEVSIIRTMRSVGSDTPGTGSQTQMGSVMGTPAYMSPEQALGEVDRLDERTDVFGLGAILCEILTGKPPYVAPSGEQVFRLASRGKLEDCYSRLDDSEVDAELLQIVRDALALEPDDRMPDSGALATRVSEYLQSVDSRLRQAELERHQAVTRSEETRKRQKVVMALAASLLVGVIASTWSAIRASQQRKLAVDSQRAEIVQRKTAEQERGKAQMLSDALALEKQELSRQQEVLRETLYSTDMAQVQAAAESRQTSRVAQLLDLQRPAAGQPDLRGFEWHYWQRKLQRGRLRSVEIPQLASTSRVRSNSRIFSRDAARLAAIIDYPVDSPPPAGFGLLSILDCLTGRELVKPFDPFPDQRQPGDNRRLIMAMSDDGTRLAAALVRSFAGQSSATEVVGRLSIRDGDAGREIRSFEIPLNVTEIALSADGSRIAVEYIELTQPEDTRQRPTSALAGVKVWDTSTGELVQSLPVLPGSFRYGRILWSPDGTRLLRQSVAMEIIDGKETFQETFQTVDVASGEELWERKFPRHQTARRAWSWSPDGKLVVIFELAEARIAAKSNAQLWDSYTGKTLAILDREAPSNSTLNATIDFSPDSQRLALATIANEVYVWELPELPLVSDGTPLHIAAPHLTLQTAGSAIQAISFNADGRELVSLDAGASIVTWDATAREEPGLGPDLGEGFFLAAISADATKVAFSGGGIRTPMSCVWDLAKNQQVFRSHTVGSFLSRPGFSADGSRVALVQLPGTPEGISQIRIYDTHTDKELSAIPVDQTGPSFGMDLTSPVFRPDGRQIAALIRPTQSSQQNPMPSRLMAWDAATGKPVFSVTVNAMFAGWLVYSLDGKSLVFGTTGQPDSAAVFYEAATGERQRSVPMPSSPNTGVYIDVRHQIFSNFVGTDALFSDLETGQERLRLRGYADINDCAISPDGTRIAVGRAQLLSGGESEITLWSLKSGRQLLALKRQGTVENLSFSPDGHRLIAAFQQSGSTTLKPIQIWDATPLPEKP